VTLKESFKIAADAAAGAPDPARMDGFAGSIMATVFFGFWWWIRGVPEDDPSVSDRSPDPN